MSCWRGQSVNLTGGAEPAAQPLVELEDAVLLRYEHSRRVGPPAQSALVTQAVAHRPVAGSHAYGAHAIGAGVAQLPLPSQAPAGCEASPVHAVAPPQAVAPSG